MPGTCGGFDESSQIANPPSGGSVYVPEGETSQYSIDTDGMLSPKNPAIVPGSGISIAITPNDQYVYETDGKTKVLEYAVGAGGTLSPTSQASVVSGTSTSPSNALAVSPDGRSLYVANGATSLAGSVSEYTIAADGSLAPKSSPTIATGIEPLGVLVSPNGRYAYVTNDRSGTVSQYAIAGDGTLSVNPDAATVTLSPAALGIVESTDGHNVYVTQSVSPAGSSGISWSTPTGR